MSDVRGRAERWSEMDITREEYDALQHLIETGTLPKEYTMNDPENDFETCEPRNPYIMAKQLEWSRSSMNDPCREIVEILMTAFAGEDDEPSSYAVGETIKVLLRIPESLLGTPVLAPTVNNGIDVYYEYAEPRLTPVADGMHIRFVARQRPQIHRRFVLVSIPNREDSRHYIFCQDDQTGKHEILDYTPEALVEKIRWFYGEPSA